jgi:tetratricopeptide (TPR) repeat protein
LATGSYNLGYLLSGQKRWAEAEVEYRRTLTALEQLGKDIPDAPDVRKDLVRSHTNLGWVLREVGHPEAEVEYRRALVIVEHLVKDFPNTHENLHLLAATHNGLGLLLSDSGRRKGAETQFRKAFALWYQLVTTYPSAPGYRVDLGGAYCSFGKWVLDGGEPEKSVEWFRMAIDTLRPALEQAPRDEFAKRFLRNSHRCRAMAYDQLQKHAAAVKDWDRAIELSPPAEQAELRARRATSRLNAGQVAEAVAEVAELTMSPNWNTTQQYDFACVYSVASGEIADKKAEYADRAMELLQKAANAGFKDATHIKADKDLDPLRDRDDFKKLLAEVEKRFALKELAPPPREKK